MAEIIAKLEDFTLSRQEQPKGTIQKVGIIGCGSMGQQIAKTISQHGFDVVCLDIDDQHVVDAIAGITAMLDDEIRQWGMTNSEKRLILSRITGTCNYKELSDCDIVIETVSSKVPGAGMELRKEIFKKLEQYISPDAIITSNTAVLMISDLAVGLKYPERAVGLHFMAPADKVKVLEVVRGAKTSETAYNTICRFAHMLEKKPVLLQESPGNLTTRMIVVMINEACQMLMEGIASIPGIDETMKMNLGYTYGPFELADRIGLDKVMKWMEGIYDEFGEKAYKTSPIIKKLVRANHFGKSTGQGFYKYDANGKVVGYSVNCLELK